ncbi:50S ribosomal protein L27 [Candidatus Microgenomates bacterium]|nr:50S ribosomal protein L27 [Candidatus Microgenomates bacterium]
MAHRKQQGSATNLKDSPGQRLGVKRFAGQVVKVGAVLVRQRGSTKLAGAGTKLGRDYTIYAVRDGKVAFRKVKKTRYSGRSVPRTEISIVD